MNGIVAFDAHIEPRHHHKPRKIPLAKGFYHNINTLSDVASDAIK